MSHRGTQSRLTSLLMLITRQQCSFLCDIFFRRMCMRICYVHFCCQPTPQLQNYSILWMITYQENWIGHFVSVYSQTEWLPWLDSFLVLLLRSKRSLLNVCTVSSIEKCWLAEKCHLNLTTFCRTWLKLSTTLKYIPLTHVCSHSSVRRWTQRTHVFYYTQKQDGFLKVGRSLARVFELRELLQIFLLEKQSPLATYFSDTELVKKLAYLCDIFNLLNELNLSLQGRTTVFNLADKVAAFKAKLELWGQWINIGIFDVSNISRDFERDWARAFFLPAGAWSPISAFRRVWALIPNHKRPLNWEGMDPWPTCE